MTEPDLGNSPAAPFKHGGNLQEISSRSGVAEKQLLDFSANINPEGPPEYLRALINANIHRLSHYPDPNYNDFREAVAGRCQVEPAQIIFGNGTSEIIYALPRAVKMTRVYLPAPSYIGYEEAMQAANVPIEFLPATADMAFDWANFPNLSDNQAVFLGNPNNPSGQLLDMKALKNAAIKYPLATFIIDEAFIDFTAKQPTAIPLIKHIDNIIVLRSMTKFYAIPGLRLGYAVAAPTTAVALERQLPPWRLNTLAAIIGSKIIKDEEYAHKSRNVVDGLRQELREGLQKLPGFKLFPSQANYLLVKIESKNGRPNASQIAGLLLDRGIALRRCDNFAGLDDNYLRIAVRPATENERLLTALNKILRPASSSPRPAKKAALMFQGVCSDAGKSIMTAAMGRILHQDGVQAAPFKSQNMSLNSFVTLNGEEMGRAQVVQAQACRLEPDVRMNPILLKPSSQVGSQVIVNGRSVGNMSVDEYISYKPQAFNAAKAAYDSLAAENQVMLLEGAGSPAEVNLKNHDIVNMQMARYAKAPVIIVGDIDRGGVFASFIGTMAVMAQWEQDLVAGFLINRFRGQESLLAPALSYTKSYTNKPVLGVVPYLSELGLPEEDSVSFKKGLFQRQKPTGDYVEICLIDLPHISNFTDFEALLAEPDVHFRVIKEAIELKSADAVILPGSKNVLEDLKYLRQTGLAQRITQLAATDCEIVGICGGFQILGREIADPHHVEAGSAMAGLGILPISTELAEDKTLLRRELIHQESGQTVKGYEIHHGQSKSDAEIVFQSATDADPGTRAGNVWGSYLHGIFDSDPFRYWFIENLRQRRGLVKYEGNRPIYDLEPAFDRLAVTVRQAIDMDKIYQLLGL
jgi:cobyric acid synthase CobQ/L-threonine-O-3-phosphate decarboxylase